MNPFVSVHDHYNIWKDVAGIAGNIFAFGLFVSPVDTFRRIIKSKSTELFSGLPYIYALLNCLLSAWYGSPLVSTGNTMVMSVNILGIVFQITYISVFITYAERDKKMKKLGLLLAIFSLFAAVAVGSLFITQLVTRRVFVGCLSGGALISMFASPLFVIKLVIRTRSVEYMPFYLSLSTFLMSTAFFVYGVLNSPPDPFIYVPNGIGTLLGIVQLALYFYYKDKSPTSNREPLILTYA
ncbi:bidirectional sugar transporter SWEET2-like [Impatiens glandulifera]|uniref:bidirectional sugar transporter SWEET2-like n=1 Tax=Impatiens glandulifera TaxID=253017 RepID=UPI001FB0D739|nr:bidirectional sugar transporter SWEET2-like [Impatiens glandulifera]